MTLVPGDVLDGKYQIVRLLGTGGMGAVYEGLNVRIHRRVAIKVLHGNVAGNAEAVERFEREAQAAGRIGSSHIVEVLDLGDLPSGDRYMVMEYLEGQSLAERVRARGKLPPQEIYPIAVQLLEGLAAAHAAGIVHRDLKPDNVYLITSKRDGGTDFVKILDFGISKFNTLGGEFSMTRTGAVMGTPYYMSPEQAKGARALDQRADLYAVGVILYECSSGRVPFQAQTFNELLFKIVLEEPPPLRELQAGLDEGFIALVAKAMARDVEHRYQSAAEFQKALHGWAQGAGLGDGGVTGHTLPLGAARPAPPAATPPAVATPGAASPAGASFPAGGTLTAPPAAAAGMSTSDGPTPATAPGWARTEGNGDPTVPPARRGGSHAPWLVAGGLGVALIGGGVALLLGGGPPDPAPSEERPLGASAPGAGDVPAFGEDGPSTAPDAADAPPANAAPPEAPSAGEASPEAPSPQDSTSQAPAAQPSSAQPSSAQGASPKPSSAEPSPAEGSTQGPSKQSSPQPAASRPRPAATSGSAPSAATPTPQDKAKTSTGRTIRSTL
ncbi:MAG: protein kinase [Myxococcales bacterium]|nr:protein kinase [Myxococcales bacterium]